MHDCYNCLLLGAGAHGLIVMGVLQIYIDDDDDDDDLFGEIHTETLLQKYHSTDHGRAKMVYVAQQFSRAHFLETAA